MAKAAALFGDNSKLSIPDRIIGVIRAINIEGSKDERMLEVIHLPQNALLHQKSQEKLIREVVPMIAELIEEGNRCKMFHSKYPAEAAEMIIVYSNTAFDKMSELSSQEMKDKIEAFIYHTEKILGAKEKKLEAVIKKIITKQ